MRVTQSMMHHALIYNMRRSYGRMSGIDLYSRVNTASDDPAGAEQMVRLRSLLARNEDYQANAHGAQRWLEATDAALSGLHDNYQTAMELALSAADSSTDLDGLADSLEGILDNLLQVANSELGGAFIFGGAATGSAPFEMIPGSVLYQGDNTTLATPVSRALSLRYNVPGSEIFTPQEAVMNGGTDWDPALNWSDAISALFDGEGVELGKVRITTGVGDVAVIDLSGARSVAEIGNLIQNALPDLDVNITQEACLEISDSTGGPLLIEDVQGGNGAAVLGLAGSHGDGSAVSRDLDPCLLASTPLDTLRGLQLPLESIEVRINDAVDPIVVDLSGALTVGDLMSTMNAALPDLRVHISDSGNRLHIEGTGFVAFEISDANPGNTATQLGLVGLAIPNRPFDVLFELKEAIEEEDRDRIQLLLPELQAVESRILGVRGAVGTRLQLAEDSLNTLQSRNLLLTESLSEIGDADMAEALMMYQNAEAAYQASLLLASNIYQMTLANFL